MNRLAARLLPYALAFSGSVCIMILELVAGRLVARHVGASLVVWTSVIGIMLGGICLGNVLGGRLADRADPRRGVGPLYALGALLTIGCLWVNAYVGRLPGLDSLSWDLRTLVVVALNFLAPGTVLGMISPVVAKMAVAQSAKSGSALGDVYFWGAFGSIVGTFFAGFVLIYWAPTSTIIAVVGLGLALLAAALMSGWGRWVGLAAALAIGLGATPLGARLPTFNGLIFPAIRANLATHLGHALVVALGVAGLLELRRALRAGDPTGSDTIALADESPERIRLWDLAALAFLGSLGFMGLEMVAGRLVTRHLGSSVFGWTSVIGVLLGGLSLGNLLGGKLADRIRREGQASHLFLVASALTLLVLVAEIGPHWLPTKVLQAWDYAAYYDKPVLGHAESAPKWLIHLSEQKGPVLRWAMGISHYPWWACVLLVVAATFFLPALAMGTIGPVVAKLAVDRVRSSRRTGATIGTVYAWGMVGSILGTFLVGFVLIDHLGTKGVILALAAVLAVAGAWLGTTPHAIYAGVSLGLCLLAFLPVPRLARFAVEKGLVDPRGNPTTDATEAAYTDESNYYYIRVDNERRPDPKNPNGPPLKFRTLVLDALIHGYDLLGHPENLEYDYEYIYADATERFVRARAAAGSKAPLRTMFLGGGSYTYPRYLQAIYPGTTADVAEIDPAVTRANHAVLGLARDTPIRTTWGDARQFVDKRRGKAEYDLIFGDAFNDFSVPWHLTTREFNDKIADLLAPDGLYMINIIDLYLSDAKAQEKKVPTARARGTGAFLGAWVKTARHSFPHIYVFGTNSSTGIGSRETFVVVAAKKPIDLSKLGDLPTDPKFYQGETLFVREPYPEADLQALDLRSRGIELTDDYAPVENLLAPVAATRAKDKDEDEDEKDDEEDAE